MTVPNERSPSADKRFDVLMIVMLSLIIFFISSSRFFNLAEKSSLGSQMPITGIAFDETFPLDVNHHWVQRVFSNFVNWVVTNQNGMIFGVLFATCLMSMLPLMGRAQKEQTWRNTLWGAVLGVPLGVCVNCAAPIAAGLRAGGARIETALATMFSSPTLNVMVLTMTFSLLPWYFGVIKILFTLILIFGVVPYLSKGISEADLSLEFQPQTKTQDLPVESLEELSNDGSWSSAVLWSLEQLTRNLWFLVKKTVPLMFLAGLLGALLVTFLPLKDLGQILPSDGSFWLLLGSLTLLVIVGTFLPVPIAFDIIMVTILMTAGLREEYCVALLYSLGSYSIYSCLLVRKFANTRLALSLFVAVCCLAIASGFTTSILGSVLRV